MEPIGGFQDPDDMDEYIATGKADLIGMARAFICDPHYYEKIWQGRPDDIVPCIRCNKCHVPSLTGHWVSMCSVNPVMGLAHADGPGWSPRLRRSSRSPWSAEGRPAWRPPSWRRSRGHDVTLYEKSGSLGGQLRIADASRAKWPVRNFKNYLARQLYKSGVNVLLNTAATPELIREGEYDAVLVGVGAVPNIPDIPGANADFVRTPISVYGDHESLGKRVVVVGRIRDRHRDRHVSGGERARGRGPHEAGPSGLRRDAHPLRGDGPPRVAAAGDLQLRHPRHHDCRSAGAR